MQSSFLNLTLEELESLNKLHMDNIDYILALGRRLFLLGRWAEAVECVQRAMILSPTSVDALGLLSEVQEQQGDIYGAIALIDQMLKICKEPSIYLRKAKLYLSNSEYDSAIFTLNEGVVNFPEDLNLLSQKCNILELLRRVEECKINYEKLVKLSGNDIFYRFDYGVFLRNAGFYDEAKAIFVELDENINLPLELKLKVSRYISEATVSKNHFAVAARLLTQLGEQMIENEIVALSELIKNAYDAKSPNVKIVVDTEYVERGRKLGRIIISDIGSGMTKEVIEKYWLTISTSIKLNQKRNSNNEDIPLGEKGIGRLSAHRLGHNLVIESKVEQESKKTYLEVDWEKFEYNTEITIDNIDVIISEIEEKSNEKYTILTITKLRNPDFWKQIISDSNKKYALQKALFSMVSPFKGIQEAFNIDIEINGNKLHMDTIDEGLLELISTVKLELCFDFNNDKGEWESNIITTLNPEFFKTKTKKHISTLSEHDPKWLNRYYEKIRIPEEPIVIPALLSQEQLFDRMKDLWETQLFGFKSPGPFKILIYGFSRDNSIKERVKSELAKIFGLNAKKLSVTDYFNSIKGVKIYRDGFRIFPYGDSQSLDWLGLDQSATSYGSYDDLKSANTTGYIILTGKNKNLREKTNREGFIADIHSTVFFRICALAINSANNIIRKNLEDIRTVYNELIVQLNEELEQKRLDEEKDIEEIETKLNNVVKKSNSDHASVALASTALQFTKTAKKHVEITKEQIKVIEEKNKSMISNLERVTQLASFGMLVEAFTHEFDIQGSKLKSILDNLLTVHASNLLIKGPLSDMRTIVNILDGYIKYLSPLYQKERNRRSRINLYMLLSSIYGENSNSFISSRAKRNNIQINILGSQMVALGNQGLLTQVFDNLFLNSEYWLNYSQEKHLISQKQFNIEIEHESKLIRIWDNGQGIDPSVESELFDAFTTTKPDNEGRGLGLYIVKTTLEMMKIRIYLDEERNKFNRRFRFIMDFSKNGV